MTSDWTFARTLLRGLASWPAWKFRLLSEPVQAVVETSGVIKQRNTRDCIDNHEQASLDLWQILPEDQKNLVFKGTAQAEIQPDYLGDILTYKRLAELIPLHWTVVDLGCSYNAQSFLFEKHRRHIAVDFGNNYNEDGEDFDHLKTFRFQAPRCEFFDMTIKQFIDAHVDSLDLTTTFAILNWVPPWIDDNNALVRQAFRNMFILYPAGESIPIIRERSV